MPYKDPKKRKAHHKKYMRDVWYPKNRKKHIERVNKRRNKNRREVTSFLNLYKTIVGCKDCGNTDFRVLDFDHLRDKKFVISQLMANTNGLKADKEKIVQEIKKCDVRCSNCHRIITYERRCGVIGNGEDS